jgi:acetamidase/formamidase
MSMRVLQPHDGPIAADHYLASTPATVTWGWLPTAERPPVLTMRSGETLVVDTVSHEGILEDQGRDPVGFFKQFGVAAADVLRDAIDIAASYAARDANAEGPHIVTGPVAVAGARPGDLLKVEFLEFALRAPYGIISNRHGYGALAGEMPPRPHADFVPDFSRPESAGTVSLFCPVSDGLTGNLAIDEHRALRFPLAPFLGLVGVTPAGPTALNSVPPGPFGGNIDIKDLVAGTTLYLPVQVAEVGLYVGDPHFAQGHGEVALTALEAPLRARLRVSVLSAAGERSRFGLLDRPFAETPQHWIAVGLHRDLNEAFRAAVREALRVLKEMHDVPAEIAYAYLSAAGDFVVSQVVDDVKGVHCLIRKADFARWA